jgi:hypothetical protein
MKVMVLIAVILSFTAVQAFSADIELAKKIAHQQDPEKGRTAGRV